MTGNNIKEIEELISRKNFVNTEIYDVKKTKEVFNQHLNGDNHYMFLWQFINTHLWHKMFFGE